MSLLFYGCETVPPETKISINNTVNISNKANIDKSKQVFKVIKVGLFLPLSGPNAKIGKSILNATQLSLSKTQNSNIEIFVRDTEDINKNIISSYYELINNQIIDKAPMLNIDKITGGRAVVSGHIIGEQMDIFAANERGPNFLYFNENGTFRNFAEKLGVEDVFENGRGTTLTDFLYRGELDIVTGNWKGEHRIFLKESKKFNDVATDAFKIPSRIRTIISADFDNDGYDEIFMNNIGEPNKLFKISNDGELNQIQLNVGLETYGLGTGAAVADIDNDGILELLISHGESGLQPLSLYKANIKKPFRFLRIFPKTIYNAPARGSTVILNTNLRKHAKTIDAGSGYLCQMEPVAHYGLRTNEKVESVTIKWTDGSSNNFKIDKLNTTYIFRKGI